MIKRACFCNKYPTLFLGPFEKKNYKKPIYKDILGFSKRIFKFFLHSSRNKKNCEFNKLLSRKLSGFFL